MAQVPMVALRAQAVLTVAPLPEVLPAAAALQAYRAALAAAVPLRTAAAAAAPPLLLAAAVLTAAPLRPAAAAVVHLHIAVAADAGSLLKYKYS